MRPSAIAVVDPAGDLLAFQRMDGVRPASADLAIEEGTNGCAAASGPTEERSKTALIRAERPFRHPPASVVLRGGMPIRVKR